MPNKLNTRINEKTFDSFPALESERLIYREFHKQDAQNLFEIRSNDEVMNYMDTVKQQSIDDAMALISNITISFTKKTGINWVIVEKSRNQFIGYFGFWRLIKDHCRAEIGYALNPEFWGNGYMIEAMDILLDFGFNKLNVHSIEANVNPYNKSSIRLLEKSGFKKEAHFRENYLFDGKFIDSIIYSLLESDPR